MSKAGGPSADEPSAPPPRPDNRLRNIALGIIAVAALVVVFLLGKSVANPSKTAADPVPTLTPSESVISSPTVAQAPPVTLPVSPTSTKSTSGSASAKASPSASKSTKASSTAPKPPTGPRPPTETAQHTTQSFSVQLPPNGTEQSPSPEAVTLSVPDGIVITSATGPSGTAVTGIDTNIVHFTAPPTSGQFYFYAFVISFPPGSLNKDSVATFNYFDAGKPETYKDPI